MGRSDLGAVTNASLPNSQASLPGVVDTFTKVRDLLQERYGIDSVKVKMDAELGSLGLDSLSLIECAFDLEKSLNVTLSDLPHELSTIGDLVRYISEVRGRTGAEGLGLSEKSRG